MCAFILRQENLSNSVFIIGATSQFQDTIAPFTHSCRNSWISHFLLGEMVQFSPQIVWILATPPYLSRAQMTQLAMPLKCAPVFFAKNNAKWKNGLKARQGTMPMNTPNWFDKLLGRNVHRAGIVVSMRSIACIELSLSACISTVMNDICESVCLLDLSDDFIQQPTRTVASSGCTYSQ